MPIAPLRPGTQAKAKAPKANGKVNQLDAAVQVLKEKGKPMNCEGDGGRDHRSLIIVVLHWLILLLFCLLPFLRLRARLRSLRRACNEAFSRTGDWRAAGNS
jgi:hypothetical protein